MRVDNVRDLGLHLRERRRGLGRTQADLAREAGVSRRWLSDLEAGKPTAEIGLVFRTVRALGMDLSVDDTPSDPNVIDLDLLLPTFTVSREPDHE